MKKFALAWLGATVVGFALSGIWHAMLLGETYAVASEAVARPDADVSMAMVLAGYVVLGLLMALIFPIGDKGGPAASEGFRFGAVIGLLWILPWSLVIVGIWQVGIYITLIDSAWHVIEQGLSGIVVAYAYRMR